MTDTRPRESTVGTPGEGQPAEVVGLRRQIADLQRTLSAIREGAVDAVVIGGPAGEQLYTLVSADRPYRVIVEEMADGALTVSERGVVLYANRRMRELAGRSGAELLGGDAAQLVDPSMAGALAELLAVVPGTTRQSELELRRPDGTGVPVVASTAALEMDGVVVRCLIATDLTERRRRERELQEAQRIGRIGSWYWDAATDRVDWSPQMYAIFGIDPAAGPLTFRMALAAASHPDDAPAAAAARDRALVDHRPFTVTQRVIHPDGEVRHTVTRGEVVRGADGAVAGLRGTTQDVTDQQRATAAVLEAREALLRQTLELAEEHRIKQCLQRAVLPAHLPALPGIALAARYLPADSPQLVGGDWYDAFPLPDSGLAVSVGDVVGHDLNAAAAMSQLRNALRAYACAGAPPASVLARLDRLTSSLGEGALATAVHARLDPGRRRLRWASAGHLPPLLIGPGGPRLLRAPRGAMLGARPGSRFTTATTALGPTDVLVFYTDGLIERRCSDLDADLAALLTAAADLAGASPDQICAALVERLLPDGHQDDVCLLAAGPPSPATQRPTAPSAWPEQAPPSLGGASRGTWAATPGGPADVTAFRTRLREHLRRRRDLGDDVTDRLLHVIEELAANGLRHGEAPVQLTVVHTAEGCLIEVTDTAFDRPPAPALHRDPALGGLGLPLVARLSTAHGWYSDGHRKHVWAHLAPPPVPGPIPAARRTPLP